MDDDAVTKVHPRACGGNGVNRASKAPWTGPVHPRACGGNSGDKASVVMEEHGSIPARAGETL